MTTKNFNQDFIKSILLKVGFKDNEGTDMLVGQTILVFDNWIQTEILSALSNDQISVFEDSIANKGTDEDIYNFFAKSIKDFDSFMDGLYGKFEKMYIENYKKALNK